MDSLGQNRSGLFWFVMKSKIYTTSRIVQEQDLDEMNHVNNVVYLEYLQDLATEHWEKFVPAIMLEEINWVVRKHEIEYFRPAKLNDLLILKTWVESFTGVTSIRHYEIYLNDLLIVKAQTEWVAVDPTSHKPKRLHTEALIALFFE